MSVILNNLFVKRLDKNKLDKNKHKNKVKKQNEK